MSVKRQATTELNHDNWDQEEPVVEDDLSGFKVASKDILEKRVIRTAKRRTQATNEEPKKSVFSGFGGFKKQQPTSFDFLSKLTNLDNENNSVTSKADSSVTSSLFTNKSLATNSDAGLFSVKTSTVTSSPFGSSALQAGSSSLLGVTSPKSSTPSIFTSKADSTVGDSPFKIQTVTSSTNSKVDSTKSTTTNIFTTSKSIDTNTSSNILKQTSSPTSSLFQIKPATNTVPSNDDIKKSETRDENKPEVKSDSKMKYYSKLKHLNLSVSEWIKKHVEQTPLCILTPIFKDYEKYIKQLQDEYQGSGKEETKAADKPTNTDVKSPFGSLITKPTPAIKDNSTPSNLFATSQSNTSLETSKPAFSFGITTSVTSSVATSSIPTFSFGMSTKPTQSFTTSASLFSMGTTSTSSFSFAGNTSTVTTNGSSSGSPFSFGVSKPFSFSSNIKQNTNPEETNKDEDEDTPPKVEYTPVVEENSVYDKKCKIFVKKDGNFVDKGVGTLYIKKIEESEKHQLLVRANTNLGTVLVNLILVSAIPTQRMGKNNVMMVCIPTPESKPPPTPILIRVKTSEEADELLATLDKYKV